MQRVAETEETGPDLREAARELSIKFKNIKRWENNDNKSPKWSETMD